MLFGTYLENKFMNLKDYIEYLDLFSNPFIEYDIPDDEVCISIKEIDQFCKKNQWGIIDE